MGKISPKRRSFEIKKKKKRAKNLARLRKLYLEASSDGEKEKIFQKVLKIAPWLPKEEFLKSVSK